MAANYEMTIVCLANSRKPGGRCVAGREVLKQGYGRWVRPVSARPSAEVSVDERRYENGADPKLLDIVTVPMIAPVPKMHQTENHMLNAEYYWSKDGALKWADLASLVEMPQILWNNGNSTYHGINDAIAATDASQLNQSLYLIKPSNLAVQVQTEGGMFGPAKKRVRADFMYNGANYRFMTTDPIAEEVFLAKKEGAFKIDEAYLCVSLTEPYPGDGRCHKLVASIITKKPLE